MLKIEIHEIINQALNTLISQQKKANITDNK
jgi:hypothetical protein